ncbi:MAG TPA: UbiD family decarboxylase [Nitrososphaerales archaeon]|nr:UbiD family decarboxylase [Nitrososphaerales archaeon]
MDLREYITQATEMGELQVVKGAHWNLEIGALTDLNAKKRGPALLFDEIVDYPSGYRVLTCMLSGPKRLSAVLGFEPTSDHSKLVSSLEGKPFVWEERAKNFPPRVRNDADVMANTLDEGKIDLFKFPAPKWHEEDGGRYIGTGGTVITRDPDIGVVNLGTYRVMISSKNALCVLIEDIHHASIQIRKYHAIGKPCPVALSFGHEPLVYLASSLPIPYELSEYNYAGAINEKPIEVFQGKLTGLPIPASSEIAAEGFIYPGDLLEEGPFGEFTGYYAGDRAPRPAIRLKALYHRNNPIILGSLTGKPPFDHSYWRTVLESAAIKDRLRKAGIPDVVKVWRHEAGACQFWTVVSIKQRYLGQAKQAGFVAAQCQEGASMGRYVIVVDEDVDPTDLQEVIWALSTRSDPATSIDIIHRAPSNPLDPLIRKPAKSYSSSRAIIDACRPFEWINEFPKSVIVSKDLHERVAMKWPNIAS